MTRVFVLSSGAFDYESNMLLLNVILNVVSLDLCISFHLDYK